MDEKTLNAELRKTGDNSTAIAEAVAGNPALLPILLDGIMSPRAAVKYKSIKVLRVISQKYPRALDEQYVFFEGLLSSQNNILKWNAIDITANIALADRKKDLDALLAKYHTLLNEGTLITAAHVVESLGKLAAARPDLHERITSELLTTEVIPLPTGECRAIVKGKTILALSGYFDQTKDKERVIGFVKAQLGNTRRATGKKALAFLKEHGVSAE